MLAVYDEDKLIKTYIADSEAVIKGVSETDLECGKLYIWDKNLQPCIEAQSAKLNS